MPARPAAPAIRSNIVMLTADAFGVLPPIARLTPAQAMYHFLSGYTAKVAGTEKGVTEPRGDLLDLLRRAVHAAPSHRTTATCCGELIAEHDVDCWLVNTGWTGGAYGTGQRMPIKATRALLAAALDGSLEQRRVPHRPEFRLRRAGRRAGRRRAPSSIRARPGPTRPPMTARPSRLVGMFIDNFAKFEAPCRRGGAGRRSAHQRSRGIAASHPAISRPGCDRAFSFAARRAMTVAMSADDKIIIADEAVIHAGRPCTRTSSARPVRAGRTSTRSRRRCSCASMPPMRRACRSACASVTIKLAGQRATKDGVIVIEAGRFRTQEQNRADARGTADRAGRQGRRTAAKPPRKKTRPSKGAVERRLKSQGRALDREEAARPGRRRLSAARSCSAGRKAGFARPLLSS